MRALAVAVLSLVYLTAPAFAMNLRGEMPSTNIEDLVNTKCVVSSQDNFIMQVEAAYGKKATYITKGALERLLAYINADRAQAKLFPYEADTFAFMYITEPGKEPRVGMVFFFEGCMLPGTAVTMTLEDAAKLFVNAGISEHDFTDKPE